MAVKFSSMVEENGSRKKMDGVVVITTAQVLGRSVEVVSMKNPEVLC